MSCDFSNRIYTFGSSLVDNNLTIIFIQFISLNILLNRECWYHFRFLRISVSFLSLSLFHDRYPPSLNFKFIVGYFLQLFQYFGKPTCSRYRTYKEIIGTCCYM